MDKREKRELAACVEVLSGGARHFNTIVDAVRNTVPGVTTEWKHSRDAVITARDKLLKAISEIPDE